MWWADYVKQNGVINKSPLTQLDAVYLAAPATSVASECMFSIAGDTSTATRNRLSAEHLHMLVLLDTICQLLVPTTKLLIKQ
jgi:hypothetical protein